MDVKGQDTNNNWVANVYKGLLSWTILEKKFKFYHPFDIFFLFPFLNFF